MDNITEPIGDKTGPAELWPAITRHSEHRRPPGEGTETRWHRLPILDNPPCAERQRNAPQHDAFDRASRQSLGSDAPAHTLVWVFAYLNSPV